MGPRRTRAGRSASSSLRLAGAGLVTAAALGTGGLLVAGSVLDAAAAATTTATVTWSGSEFGATPRLHVGDAVRWRNASAFDLVVKGTTSNWSSYSKTVAPQSTSAAYTFTKAGTYSFHGTGGLLGTSSDSGTIFVTAPKPSPTPAKTKPPPADPTARPHPSTSSKPQGKPGKPTHHKPRATPSPPFAGGVGSAGNPALGAGDLTPPFTAGSGGGQGPRPLVASPGVTPTPVPTSSVDAFGDPAPVGEATLAQPVPARRYGLPGAVAAVLVAGVVVGVVRLARAEYGPLD